MKDRHGWNSWDDYLAVHTRRIDDFSHFIIEDKLEPTITETLVSWKGVLYCEGQLEIHVEKTQEVRYEHGRPEVKTLLYSYHVLQRKGTTSINLFRYDNVHPHPGHQDAHHHHSYTDDGTELDPPQHVGHEGWPTLGDVINEAHDLWLKQRLGR